MSDIQSLKFSVNHWEHLYSLQMAIAHSQQRTGSQLHIQGQVNSHHLLKNQQAQATITFIQSDGSCKYTLYKDSNDAPIYLLGEAKCESGQISIEMLLEKQVFDELRKNLMEYADIEGIHIVVTLGLVTDKASWQEGTSLPLIQLDYAMRGDA